MSRDIEPRLRDDEDDRPDPGRGGGPTEDFRATERTDPRDVFARAVDLPKGAERERVDFRDHAYDLRGSDVRVLTTIGAFRAVPADDLRDAAGRALNARTGELYQLRRQGLVRTVAPTIRGHRRTLVTLTQRGQQLLDTYRAPDARQTFRAGVARARDLEHDAHVYRAYVRAADRLSQEGAQVVRVVLEADLKREYQAFLQDGNRGQSDSDGRPTQSSEDIRHWAEEHQLPVFDDRVHFPDVRLEYEQPDGRRGIEDVEVVTAHYRGAHAAGKARAGFTRYRTSSARIGGHGGGAGGRPFDPRVAEEWL
jgi:hypothetical protein